MGHLLLAAPLVALVLQFGAVAHAQDMSDPPVEYKLAVIQTGGYVSPDDILVKKLGWALDDLQDRCNESRGELADFSVVAHDALAARGVAEPYLAIIEHVNENAFYMLNADPDAPGRLSCVGVFTDYVITGGARL